MKRHIFYKPGTTQAGFTLIELLIVSTITVMLLLGVSSMFMTVLLSNTKTNISRQIKTEGNQLISQLEYVLRGAKNISVPSQYIACRSGLGQDFNFVSNNVPITVNEPDGTTHIISYDAGNQQLLLDNNPLNSSFVIVANTSSINCTQDSATGKITITISVTLARVDGSTIQESFQSTVQLRNS